MIRNVRSTNENGRFFSFYFIFWGGRGHFRERMKIIVKSRDECDRWEDNVAGSHNCPGRYAESLVSG